MAITSASLRTKTVTMRILDMAGTEVHSSLNLKAGSAIPPMLIPRIKGRIDKNTSSGNALAGTFNDGIVSEGLDVTFSIVTIDPNNTGEVTQYQTFRGLHDGNPTSATGYGSYNFTSTLDLKGEPSATFEWTERDVLGNANICTAYATVRSVTPSDDNGTSYQDITINLVSAPAWT